MKDLKLFEYQYSDYENISNPLLLKEYLNNIWENRFTPYIDEWEEDNFEDTEQVKIKKYQPFLNFSLENLNSNNFVGFIQFEDTLIEIYPKVFRNSTVSNSKILSHIFYWFDYCRKWKFPFNKSNLDSFHEMDFPELIIFLMASKIHDTISNNPISFYQNIEEALVIPKGKINFDRYITNGMSTGNFHIIDCDYDPFMFDNKLNRAIKYCCRLLLDKTKNTANQKILQELVFIMDEVEDTYCTLNDLESIFVNSYYEEYQEIKDICRIILQNMLYSNRHYDLNQWCLLFPMEYIFEDYLAGFIEDNFSEKWKVEYQKSNLYLTHSPNAFKMKHDIFLSPVNTNMNSAIIIDAKYKLRNVEINDLKKDVSQSDMYQMVSYAFRSGCKNVIMLYPNSSDQLDEPYQFKIKSDFFNNEEINITVAEIPFWTSNKLEDLEQILKNRLNYLFTLYDK